jgi:predicted nicotinamide N-methyase
MSLTYPAEILQLEIGHLRVKLAQIKDPEKLFDELLSKSKDHPDVINENIPYWGELWPSAIGLSQFLTENSGLIKGKNILEIGCGLGLPGIVASLLGGNVTMSDYLPAALQFAEYNWKLNIDSTPDLRLLDWRSLENVSPSDVLLASDIAYESKSFVPIILALKSLVNTDGIILLSEPNRVFAKKFFRELQDEFSFTLEVKKVLKDGIENKISIYTLRKK